MRPIIIFLPCISFQLPFEGKDSEESWELEGRLPVENCSIESGDMLCMFSFSDLISRI